MPTGITYTPVVGNFSAPFSIVSGDGTAIPVNVAIADQQGAPRPGKIKWGLVVRVPDPTLNNDNVVTMRLPVPFNAQQFTAPNLAVMGNTFTPLALVMSLGATGVANVPVIATLAPAGWSVANQTVSVELTLTSPQPAASSEYLVVVDFSHSIIN